MENGYLALFPLLILLGLIKRIRDKRATNTLKINAEERKTPSFQLPDATDVIMRDEAKQKEHVWNELIRIHQVHNFHFGIYEAEKYIDATFAISEKETAQYRYQIFEEELNFTVCVLFSYPIEITTDLFVLASHFNNRLNFGKVVIDVENQNVIFTYRNDLAYYALFKEKIHFHLKRHFHISKDIHEAFVKCVLEREEPAVIFGELMKKLNQENNPES